MSQAIQAVHTPYNPVPGWHGDTYEGMLWDSDVYVGAIVGSLKAKQMYDSTVIVYSADSKSFLHSILCAGSSLQIKSLLTDLSCICYRWWHHCRE